MFIFMNLDGEGWRLRSFFCYDQNQTYFLFLYGPLFVYYFLLQDISFPSMIWIVEVLHPKNLLCPNFGHTYKVVSWVGVTSGRSGDFWWPISNTSFPVSYILDCLIGYAFDFNRFGLHFFKLGFVSLLPGVTLRQDITSD